jgi:hypothetical protein
MVRQTVFQPSREPLECLVRLCVGDDAETKGRWTLERGALADGIICRSEADQPFSALGQHSDRLWFRSRGAQPTSSQEHAEVMIDAVEDVVASMEVHLQRVARVEQHTDLAFGDMLLGPSLLELVGHFKDQTAAPAAGVSLALEVCYRTHEVP